MSWKFDESISRIYEGHVLQHIPLYEKTINYCLDYAENHIPKDAPILDFGCATGDSAILLKIFFPNAKIFLHDLSSIGVEKGINKYSRFLPVSKYKPGEKADLVYCSNVIEHVKNPIDLVNELINCTLEYVLIQCPWEEIHPVNGKLISPENQTDEHTWTINEDFYEKYIKDPRIRWTFTKGVVPMA